MTKEQVFKKIDEIYCDADGGIIQIGAEGENQIKELIQQAINYTRCCEELKDKKGTDFEEFCGEHFIYKNSNTYSKESGLPVSLDDMLQKYKDLKQNL